MGSSEMSTKEGERRQVKLVGQGGEHNGQTALKMPIYILQGTGAVTTSLLPTMTNLRWESLEGNTAGAQSSTSALSPPLMSRGPAATSWVWFMPRLFLSLTPRASPDPR